MSRKIIDEIEKKFPGFTYDTLNERLTERINTISIPKSYAEPSTSPLKKIIPICQECGKPMRRSKGLTPINDKDDEYTMEFECPDYRCKMFKANPLRIHFEIGWL